MVSATHRQQELEQKFRHYKENFLIRGMKPIAATEAAFLLAFRPLPRCYSDQASIDSALLSLVNAQSNDGGMGEQKMRELIGRYGLPFIYSIISSYLREQLPKQPFDDHPLCWARYYTDLANQAYQTPSDNALVVIEGGQSDAS